MCALAPGSGAGTIQPICDRSYRCVRVTSPVGEDEPALDVRFRPVESAQYTSAAFAAARTSAGVRQSMGAAGSSADNALAEAFFATLKREMLPARAWPTTHHARLAVFAWLSFYNTRRRHSALDHLSPTDYETRPTNKLGTGRKGRSGLAPRRRAAQQRAPATEINNLDRSLYGSRGPSGLVEPLGTPARQPGHRATPAPGTNHQTRASALTALLANLGLTTQNK